MLLRLEVVVSIVRINEQKFENVKEIYNIFVCNH